MTAQGWYDDVSCWVSGMIISWWVFQDSRKVWPTHATPPKLAPIFRLLYVFLADSDMPIILSEQLLIVAMWYSYAAYNHCSMCYSIHAMLKGSLTGSISMATVFVLGRSPMKWLQLYTMRKPQTQSSDMPSTASKQQAATLLKLRTSQDPQVDESWGREWWCLMMVHPWWILSWWW